MPPQITPKLRGGIECLQMSPPATEISYFLYYGINTKNTVKTEATDLHRISVGYSTLKLKLSMLCLVS